MPFLWTRNSSIRQQMSSLWAQAMKPKSWPVLVRCVEEGVQMGWNRAHKHTDHPDEQSILEHIETEVMNAICEAFDFADSGSD